VNPLPLEGLLVADFSRVLAGPLCTQMLGDAGARVIKVEDPARGDETRRWGPPFLSGVSTYFLSVNRNKESVAIDLRSEEGKALARALVERADVVIDNFLPAQRAQFGLDDVPERTIHCSITGFDADTPDANLPGYDLLAQASSGLMAITGEREGQPSKVGVALGDVLTAHYAHGAILAALHGRERTGRGARLEVSLFGAAAASLVNVAQAALATGREARRYGNAHPSIVPYQLFEASDRPFVIGGGTDRHFQMLCTRVIERPEWSEDPRFASNDGRVAHRDQLVPLLESVFTTRPAAEWVGRCRAANVPAALVSGVLEALRSEAAGPLIAAVVHPEAGTYDTVRHPVRFDGERLPIRTPPPTLGQHTEAVTAELRAAATSANTTEPAERDSTETRSPRVRR
jgi:crotonobetainyl-CoA:carnitine CoA-transferase CaiB-like acyl-CoA transferase